ncbi:MAG: nSTAND1 domain-containing NTPase, partial [Gammaproteobacteria bacterium]
MSTEPDVFNPYPGLRPFEADENHLFFGRDGQSNELLRRLRRNRFLAVVGTSGCGKSSLVRAGLLADLHGGMMAERSSRWRIALFRPGADPVGNLAVALCRPGVLLPDEAESTDSEMERAFMTATLKRSALGIVEACGQHQLPEGSNLLIVVDQFEELFRFKEAGSVENASDEAAAFVKLLLSAAKHPDVPIYVIITMRSDFLGDCTQFRDLPETINDGQYLVPRMTRAERRAAIAGPAAVGGATITPGLVQRLLNDVGDNPDQLPILQHALMRTWDHWQARDPQGQPIDLPDYEAIGGMRDALSRHADEAFAEIAEDQSDQQGLQRQWIAEKLFKFLSEKGTDNREIRHPGKLADIAAAAGVEASELISVIEVFRKAQRSFLMPPASEKLKPETQIDISHESLIRNWGRLKRWVEEESNSAAIYRRLVERAALYREGREVLLTDPALYSALEWREREQPNAAWARRYHPDFEQSIGFLEESDRAFKAEQAAREERARREEVARRRELEQARELASARKAMVDAQSKAARNSRRFAVVFFVLFVAAAVSGIFGWIRNEEAAAHREYDTIREVAEFAKDESGGNPEKAGLIAIEALKAIVKASKIDNFRAHRRALALDAVFHLDSEKPKVADDQLPEVAEALRQALRNLELNGRRLGSGRRVIRSAAFSEDAKEIVAVDSFGTVQRWDALNL